MTGARLDDLVGLDVPAIAPATGSAEAFHADALARFLAVRQQQRLRHARERLAALPSGLEPFRHLPPAEAATLTRTRMAATIAERMAATGSVTEGDLARAGFSPAEIAAHFRAALRASRAAEMVV